MKRDVRETLQLNFAANRTVVDVGSLSLSRVGKVF